MNKQEKLKESTLICKNCGATATLYVVGDYNAAEKFHRIGWRAINQNKIYCPKCVKIKLN